VRQAAIASVASAENLSFAQADLLTDKGWAQALPRLRCPAARCLRPISASVGGGEKQRVDRRWAAGCAWHCPCMGKSANLGQLALKKHALNAGRQACDAPNLGHDCAHAIGFPIRRASLKPGAIQPANAHVIFNYVRFSFLSVRN